jgi:hypothetical protein
VSTSLFLEIFGLPNTSSRFGSKESIGLRYEVYDSNYDNISMTGNRAVSREENMARAQEDSVAPMKKKRVSKKTELENKQSSLETRFDDKFNKLSDLFQDRSQHLI